MPGQRRADPAHPVQIFILITEKALAVCGPSLGTADWRKTNTIRIRRRQHKRRTETCSPPHLFPELVHPLADGRQASL